MPVERKQPLQGRSILVLEDNYFIAADLRGELERAVARVLGPAPRIADALALLQKDRPDLALLDVRLGEELVYPLADVLRLMGVPVVFATAQGPEELPPAYAQAPYCEKPYDPRRLVRVLAEAAG